MLVRSVLQEHTDVHSKRGEMVSVPGTSWRMRRPRLQSSAGRVRRAYDMVSVRRESVVLSQSTLQPCAPFCARQTCAERERREGKRRMPSTGSQREHVQEKARAKGKWKGYSIVDNNAAMLRFDDDNNSKHVVSRQVLRSCMASRDPFPPVPLFRPLRRASEKSVVGVHVLLVCPPRWCRDDGLEDARRRVDSEQLVDLDHAAAAVVAVG